MRELTAAIDGRLGHHGISIKARNALESVDRTDWREMARAYYRYGGCRAFAFAMESRYSLKVIHIFRSNIVNPDYHDLARGHEHSVVVNREESLAFDVTGQVSLAALIERYQAIGPETVFLRSQDEYDLRFPSGEAEAYRVAHEVLELLSRDQAFLWPDICR